VRRALALIFSSAAVAVAIACGESLDIATTPPPPTEAGLDGGTSSEDASTTPTEAGAPGTIETLAVGTLLHGVTVVAGGKVAYTDLGAGTVRVCAGTPFACETVMTSPGAKKIANDGTLLHWTAEQGGTTDILRAPPTAGASELGAEDPALGTIRAIAASGTDGSSFYAIAKLVRRAAHNNTAPQTMLPAISGCDGFDRIAVGNLRVYATCLGNGVYSCAESTPCENTGTISVRVDTGTEPGLFVQGDRVFFASSTVEHRIHSCPTLGCGGGGEETWGIDAGPIVDLAVDNTRIFASDGSKIVILARDRVAQPITVDTPQPGVAITSIALDNQGLYFTAGTSLYRYVLQ